ncbi:NAD(P)-dependent alcohol dehydrogenase [Salinibacterium sp. dk2585]|uniref:NAD(P)-dependent alcohol dehydrogenase n=1 Tax=unclassified Salinibacterium TaxID=2632331 RepID=UPI0011C25198|nr:MULTISPECIES: NAD(P)-dependent alcohol dehydrogenase [unclassified Salinibacterium]QEE60570.1 NAD(P)-dependent alcohol dehydrogenase [Salinibacterium sp. dk2585]TXK55642.1 NAD(P)-dependent alcohol dehydrogenase [Salinibacterium sp. dk5596]
MKIQALVVEEQDAPFEQQEVELEAPGRGEALVRIAAVGVCHTDLISREGDMGVTFPAILGHEGAGVVEQVGEGVTQVAVGDKVIIGWPSCGECRNCLDGEPRYCLRTGDALVSGRRFKGEQAGTSAYSRDGQTLSGHFFGQSSFATYSLTRADALVKVPGDTPVELLGPLACGLGTGAGAVLNETRPRLGDSLLIVGVGAVGLAAIMAATNTGATTIIAADVHDNRLAMAREFGATHTINSRDNDLVEEVATITGSTVDFAYDCTGVIPVIEKMADTVGMLGTLVLIGGAPAGARFSLDHLSTLWGKRVVGVLGGGGRSGQLIPALVELFKQGRFPFDKLVRYYEFDQIEQALADSKSGEVIKPILRLPK